MSYSDEITNLLKLENIQVLDRVDSWEDGIRKSLNLLEKHGYVESRYAENIIKDTQELGPYYVLTEDIALVHARPEEGAIKKQFAVTLVHEPVVFSADSFPVRLLFALSAEDSSSHMEAIKLLAAICMDPEKVAALVNCSTPEELYSMLIGK
ncbi:MAG: PTS sugar transporter subunit IIA [Atopobium sp.]|uniref:PTS sugar transporter subunit IIA n=1 Tax=Atopobium sp. TaxID=1872650 RepID=UPI002A75761C|nr:PTS sugar transporter subunit IIA [Atopobium sp.]MDY2787985.1 PTS sugar transporter subunit IIA [Atopobium sp.]MDY4523360.1 PTS sugar transporter subunit IIA [Atopobium sp.]